MRCTENSRTLPDAESHADSGLFGATGGGLFGAEQDAQGFLDSSLGESAAHTDPMHP